MNDTRRIQPRTLKGFRDMGPELMMRKEAMLDRIRTTFRRYGFLPIDTPALEYAEVLLAKAGGETEQQVYRFLDQGGRDVALRFDLTIPFARFAATHLRQLGTPFKRYHMGPVWRGENTGRGRFREFWQCDFDTIGTRSPLADLETALVIVRLMEGLDIGSFTLHISDRGILSGLLSRLGVEDGLLPVLRAIDKLHKVGREGVTRELEVEAGLGSTAIDAVFALIEKRGDARAILAAVESELGDAPETSQGLDRLRVVMDGLEVAGVRAETVRLDLSIARGIDYYTGTVFETFLDGRPEYGSVCSGGRYDDLASFYTKDVLPGVGASLGLDRLLDAVIATGDGERSPGAGAIVLLLCEEGQLEAVRMAEELRQAGIATELYCDLKKIQKQLQYADRRGVRAAVIAGPDELAAATVSVKDLRSGEQRSGLPRAQLVAAVRAIIDPAARPHPIKRPK